ncbi:MAG: hypothetical protein JXB49_08810 [Bacteroidales bacterium]|nr:hypothetical protein [Bacteroidales bacterium]
MNTLRILTIILFVSFDSIANCQSPTNNVFKSTKYGYTVTIPKGFNQTSATGKNIDLKLINSDGTSILINVTPRRPEEYSITAHDYSKEMFDKEFAQYSPNTKVSKAEKTYLSGEKAFLTHYINTSNNTKALEIYTYKGNYAYVFTATTKATQFQTYEPLFMKVFNSFKF